MPGQRGNNPSHRNGLLTFQHDARSERKQPFPQEWSLDIPAWCQAIEHADNARPSLAERPHPYIPTGVVSWHSNTMSDNWTRRQRQTQSGRELLPGPNLQEWLVYWLTFGRGGARHHIQKTADSVWQLNHELAQTRARVNWITFAVPVLGKLSK